MYVADLGFQELKGFEDKSKIFSIVPIALKERMKYFYKIIPRKIEKIVQQKNYRNEDPNNKISIPRTTLKKLKSKLFNLQKEKTVLFSHYSKICTELPTVIAAMQNSSTEFTKHLSSIKEDIEYLNKTEATLPQTFITSLPQKSKNETKEVEKKNKKKLKKNKTFKFIKKSISSKKEQELKQKLKKSVQNMKNVKILKNKNIKLQERVKELEKQLDEQIGENEQLRIELNKTSPSKFMVDLKTEVETEDLLEVNGRKITVTSPRSEAEATKKTRNEKKKKNEKIKKENVSRNK